MSPRLLVAPKGGPEIPSSRYRVYRLLPLLEELGWQATVMTPSTRRDRRARNLARDAALAARGADVLLVQRPGRRREEEWVLPAAARRSGVVALDVDDPVGEVGAFAKLLPHADLVLAGSRAVAERYEGRIARVERVPTALDVRRYAIDARAGGAPVAGWIGDGPAYADSLTRMVAGVARAGGPWRIRVVGTLGDAALGDRLREAAAGAPLELVDGIEWQSEDAQAATVAAFDVGLAPFRNAEGGSFKTVQYLAAGAVPLAEAGGEAEANLRAALGGDAQVVPPGDGAALAERLAALADPALRARLAERGREAARRLFSVEAAAAQVDRALRAALAERRG